MNLVIARVSNPSTLQHLCSHLPPLTPHSLLTPPSPHTSLPPPSPPHSPHPLPSPHSILSHSPHPSTPPLTSSLPPPLYIYPPHSTPHSNLQYTHICMHAHAHTHALTHAHAHTDSHKHTHIHTVYCVKDLFPILQSQPSSSRHGNRASQHRLASVFSSGDISSDLAKYNQLRVGGVWGRGLWGWVGVSGARRVVAPPLTPSHPPSSGPQEAAQVLQVHHSQLGAVCDGGHTCRQDGD